MADITVMNKSFWVFIMAKTKGIDGLTETQKKKLSSEDQQKFRQDQKEAVMDVLSGRKELPNGVTLINSPKTKPTYQTDDETDDESALLIGDGLKKRSLFRKIGKALTQSFSSNSKKQSLRATHPSLLRIGSMPKKAKAALKSLQQRGADQSPTRSSVAALEPGNVDDKRGLYSIQDSKEQKNSRFINNPIYEATDMQPSNKPHDDDDSSTTYENDSDSGTHYENVSRRGSEEMPSSDHYDHLSSYRQRDQTDHYSHLSHDQNTHSESIYANPSILLGHSDTPPIYEELKDIQPQNGIRMGSYENTNPMQTPTYSTVDKSKKIVRPLMPTPLETHFKDYIQSTVTGDPNDIKHHWKQVENEGNTWSIDIPYQKENAYINRPEPERSIVTMTLSDYQKDSEQMSISVSSEAIAKAVKDVKSDDLVINQLRDSYSRALLCNYLHCLSKGTDEEGLLYTASMEVLGTQPFDLLKRTVLAEQFIAFDAWAKEKKRNGNPNFLHYNAKDFEFDEETTDIMKSKSQEINDRLISLFTEQKDVFEHLHARQENNFQKHNEAVNAMQSGHYHQKL